MKTTLLGMNHGWLEGKIPTTDPPVSGPARLDIQRGRTMDDRVRSMFQAVAMSLVEPATRKMACDAVRNCPARDDQCEVEAVASWIRSRITYRGEIPGFDLFQKIGVSVDLAAGDCDCMTIAGLSLLTEIGYTCGVRIVMFSQSEGHAYSILRLPRLTNGQQSVVPLDLSEQVAVGWEVDRGQTISAVDYWFEPVAWIAWKQSGQPLSRSPVPRAERAAPPV